MKKQVLVRELFGKTLCGFKTAEECDVAQKKVVALRMVEPDPARKKQLSLLGQDLLDKSVRFRREELMKEVAKDSYMYA